MKCKNCGKEFRASKVRHGEPYDRGDGVMYGDSSWLYTPICPHCGFDNRSKKVLRKATVEDWVE